MNVPKRLLYIARKKLDVPEHVNSANQDSITNTLVKFTGRFMLIQDCCH